MMSCRKVERDLARYVVGALPPWSRKIIVRHLDGCVACRRLVESHHRVAFLIDSVPREDPPVGLWSGVMNAIASETPGARRIPSVSSDWRPGAVVAATGLAVGMFLGHYVGSMDAANDVSSATLPGAPTAVATFVQHHNRLAANDPLVDQVSMAAYVTAAFRDSERNQGTTWEPR